MNRTHEYCRIAKAHRDGLRAIWTAYDETMQRLERYKGSSGYASDEKEAARVRDEAIKAQRAVSAREFDNVLDGMRDKVGGRAAIPPGDAELRLLQTLRLRDRISREEFQAAARALQDNSIALHTLDDIAQSHGYNGLFEDLPAWRDTTSTHQQHIASLLRAARSIVNLEKPDGRREAIRDALNNNSVASGFAFDRDFESDNEALSCYGGFRDTGDLQTFMNAVDD